MPNVPVKLQAQALDFIERVGATAFEAGAAVYVVSDSQTIKVALVAAGAAALKYIAFKVSAWQSAQIVKAV